MNPRRRYIPALVAALMVSLLPHAVRLPLWVVLWCAGMWGYLLLSLRRNWPLPGRKGRLVLSGIGLGGLLLTFRSRLGPEAYLGLLAIMAALKPFESGTHRDRMVTVFIAYFIIISSLLQVESLAVTLYMFLSVLVTTAALVRINNSVSTYGADLKFAARIMGQALPLMIILFLVFPRLHGGLFGVWQSGTARTGFSERLSPGSISRLVENDEVAFRVEFAGSFPPAHQLYWRGLVFQEFAGGSWNRTSRIPPLATPVSCENPVEYTIILEPHYRRWIFSLDRPAVSPSRWIMLRRDYTMRAWRPLTRKHDYEMISCTDSFSPADTWAVEACRNLPSGGNPRTRQLAAQLAADSGNVGLFVKRALDYLKTNPFAYTRKPPLLGNDPVDEFLFSSRRGFCEHYASAFAYLMRVGGVSARLVGGYLGGEVNPYADYLMVRQSDAHVWVEVWFPEQGWQRVDPTLAVAPERLDAGAEGDLADGEQTRNLFHRYLGRWKFWTKRLGLGWDALSTRWEAWFSRYSRHEQRQLLEKLGLYWHSWKEGLLISLLTLGILAGIIGLYGVWQFFSGRPSSDPVGKNYEKFCRKLAKAGIFRPPAMGPRDYAAFAARRRPELSAEIRAITDLYIRLRYREEADQALKKMFRRRVRAFAPFAGGRPEESA